MRALILAKNKTWVRLISYVVMAAFLCQNIAWAGGNSFNPGGKTVSQETLSPDSKIDDEKFEEVFAQLEKILVSLKSITGTNTRPAPSHLEEIETGLQDYFENENLRLAFDSNGKTFYFYSKNPRSGPGVVYRIYPEKSGKEDRDPVFDENAILYRDDIGLGPFKVEVYQKTPQINIWLGSQGKGSGKPHYNFTSRKKTGTGRQLLSAATKIIKDGSSIIEVARQLKKLQEDPLEDPDISGEIYAELKDKFSIYRELVLDLRLIDKLVAINIPGIPEMFRIKIGFKLWYLIRSEIKGISLKQEFQQLAEKPKEEALILVLARIVQVGEILEKMHESNIIHGDIVAENVIVEEGRGNTKLIDFEYIAFIDGDLDKIRKDITGLARMLISALTPGDIDSGLLEILDRAGAGRGKPELYNSMGAFLDDLKSYLDKTKKLSSPEGSLKHGPPKSILSIILIPVMVILGLWLYSHTLTPASAADYFPVKPPPAANLVIEGPPAVTTELSLPPDSIVIKEDSGDFELKTDAQKTEYVYFQNKMIDPDLIPYLNWLKPNEPEIYWGIIKNMIRVRKMFGGFFVAEYRPSEPWGPEILIDLSEVKAQEKYGDITIGVASIGHEMQHAKDLNDWTKKHLGWTESILPKWYIGLIQEVYYYTYKMEDLERSAIETEVRISLKIKGEWSQTTEEDFREEVEETFQDHIKRNKQKRPLGIGKSIVYAIILPILIFFALPLYLVIKTRQKFQTALLNKRYRLWIKEVLERDRFRRFGEIGGITEYMLTDFTYEILTANPKTGKEELFNKVYRQLQAKQDSGELEMWQAAIAARTRIAASGEISETQYLPAHPETWSEDTSAYFGDKGRRCSTGDNIVILGDLCSYSDLWTAKLDMYRAMLGLGTKLDPVSVVSDRDGLIQYVISAKHQATCGIAEAIGLEEIMVSRSEDITHKDLIQPGKYPEGAPAKCLKVLYRDGHFYDNPVTINQLMNKRSYSYTTVEIELKNLIALGLVIKGKRTRSGYQYYLCDALRRAPPGKRDTIMESICNLTLDTPSPNRSPKLRGTPVLKYYDEVTKLSAGEIKELRAKITAIILDQLALPSGNKVVFSLGGNSLLRTEDLNSGKPPAQSQKDNLAVTMQYIISNIKTGKQVIFTHGNGPEIPELLKKYPGKSLPDIIELSQRWIGNDIVEQLTETGISRDRIELIITKVVVDPDDPVFNQPPTKPIGIKPRGEDTRPRVASPKPLHIVEIDRIAAAIKAGKIVICAGGGGIPVTAQGDRVNTAVIDKDLTTALLVEELAKQGVFIPELTISTAIDGAYLYFDIPGRQQHLNLLTAGESTRYLSEGHFAAGKMGPKIEAAARVSKLGCKVTITNPGHIGRYGTVVIPEPSPGGIYLPRRGERMTLTRKGTQYILIQRGRQMNFDFLWDVFRSVNHQIDSALGKLRRLNGKDGGEAAAAEKRDMIYSLRRFRSEGDLGKLQRERNRHLEQDLIERVSTMVSTGDYPKALEVMYGLVKTGYMQEPEFYTLRDLLGQTLREVEEIHHGKRPDTEAITNKLKLIKQRITESNLIYEFLVTLRKRYEDEILKEVSATPDMETVFKAVFTEYTAKNHLIRGSPAYWRPVLYRSCFIPFRIKTPAGEKGKIRNPLFDSITDWGIIIRLLSFQTTPRLLKLNTRETLKAFFGEGRATFSQLTGADIGFLIEVLVKDYSLTEAQKDSFRKALGSLPGPVETVTRQPVPISFSKAIIHFHSNFIDIIRTGLVEGETLTKTLTMMNIPPDTVARIEMRFLYTGSASDNSDGSEGSESIFLASAYDTSGEIRGRFVIAIDNHYIGEGSRITAKNEYNNLKLAHQADPHTWPKPYIMGQGLNKERNEHPLYTCQYLEGNAMYIAVNFLSQPTIWVLDSDFCHKGIPARPGTIYGKVHNRIIQEIIQRYIRLYLRTGLVPGDLRIYEGDVMTAKDVYNGLIDLLSCPVPDEEKIDKYLEDTFLPSIRLCALRALKKGSLNDLLDYLDNYKDLFRSRAFLPEGEFPDSPDLIARAPVFSPELIRTALKRELETTEEGENDRDKNVTCGTICESGHEGSFGALDEQLEEQFEALRKIQGMVEERDLTETEADEALVKYAKGFGLKITDKELLKYRRQIKKTVDALEHINIFFSIPVDGTDLFWVQDPQTGEWTYAGGHFNRAGTRIHISLPIILAEGIDAGIAIARHELNHIKGEGHSRDDKGMQIVNAIADREYQFDFQSRERTVIENARGQKRVLRLVNEDNPIDMVIGNQLIRIIKSEAEIIFLVYNLENPDEPAVEFKISENKTIHIGRYKKAMGVVRDAGGKVIGARKVENDVDLPGTNRAASRRHIRLSIQNIEGKDTQIIFQDLTSLNGTALYSQGQFLENKVPIKAGIEPEESEVMRKNKEGHHEINVFVKRLNYSIDLLKDRSDWERELRRKFYAERNRIAAGLHREIAPILFRSYDDNFLDMWIENLSHFKKEILFLRAMKVNLVIRRDGVITPAFEELVHKQVKMLRRIPAGLLHKIRDFFPFVVSDKEMNMEDNILGVKMMQTHGTIMLNNIGFERSESFGGASLSFTLGKSMILAPQEISGREEEIRQKMSVSPETVCAHELYHHLHLEEVLLSPEEFMEILNIAQRRKWIHYSMFDGRMIFGLPDVVEIIEEALKKGEEEGVDEMLKVCKEYSFLHSTFYGPGEVVSFCLSDDIAAYKELGPERFGKIRAVAMRSMLRSEEPVAYRTVDGKEKTPLYEIYAFARNKHRVMYGDQKGNVLFGDNDVIRNDNQVLTEEDGSTILDELTKQQIDRVMLTEYLMVLSKLVDDPEPSRGKVFFIDDVSLPGNPAVNRDMLRVTNKLVNKAIYSAGYQISFKDRYKLVEALLSPEERGLVKDIGLMKELFNSLFLSTLKEDRIYEIRYDDTRLSNAQIKVIEQYIEVLKTKVCDPGNVKAIPGRRNDYIIKVTQMEKRGRKITNIVGEGEMKVGIKGKLDNYKLDIIGMMNIALAASLPHSKDRDPVVEFIKNQFRAMTGNDLPEGQDITSILLSPAKIDLDEADRLNKLAERLLETAA